MQRTKQRVQSRRGCSRRFSHADGTRDRGSRQAARQHRGRLPGLAWLFQAAARAGEARPPAEKTAARRGQVGHKKFTRTGTFRSTSETKVDRKPLSAPSEALWQSSGPRAHQWACRQANKGFPALRMSLTGHQPWTD
jgi:hypothetical protein